VYEIEYNSETESSQTSDKILNPTDIHSKSPSNTETALFTKNKRYNKDDYTDNDGVVSESLDNFKYHDNITQIDSDHNKLSFDRYSISNNSSTMNNDINYKSHPVDADVEKQLNQSTNVVIKNYLKAKEQHVVDEQMKSNRNFNDLSKKSKNNKELTKSKFSNAPPINSSGKLTTSSTTSSSKVNNQPDKMKKSGKTLGSMYDRQNSGIDEFQIEKVVSWISVNEDNFSEFEYSVAETSIAKNDKQHDKVDDTFQEIADIIKEIEDNRKDSEDFKQLKTDVEFKLNTILSSNDTIDNDAAIIRSNHNFDHGDDDDSKDKFK
jgi:hypothetical protein